ncbi:hypothetical protein [Paenibacillus sp. P32E]|uniref:hypothetical protein n=1 Tax=Paenibacillus sp. P32E TaxID=1349434 RepID=UPI0011610A02|nr:hypothetical protein [Paenibacillus sp. P32E]
MSSGQKKHRRITPMPVVSSFSPPNRETCHSEPITWKMTEEDWAKYGPKSDLKRKGNHYMTSGKVKKDGNVGSKSKANGRGKNDTKGKVEGQGSAKVSGL